MICGSQVEGAGSSMQGAGTKGLPKELQREKLSVWWDLENCPIPKDENHPERITCNIIEMLRRLGYCGDIAIYVYGNTRFFSAEVQNAMNSSGVLFVHVPSGKDATDKRIMVDLMTWGYDNPKPASYLLISGDRDYLHMLKTLQDRGYNILLAGQRFAYDPHLVAHTVWKWDSLLKGELP